MALDNVDKILFEAIIKQVGVWLSLVEYLNGVQGVASSNLVTPTIFLSQRKKEYLFHPKLILQYKIKIK